MDSKLPATDAFIFSNQKRPELLASGHGLWGNFYHGASRTAVIVITSDCDFSHAVGGKLCMNCSGGAQEEMQYGKQKGRRENKRRINPDLLHVRFFYVSNSRDLTQRTRRKRGENRRWIVSPFTPLRFSPLFLRVLCVKAFRHSPPLFGARNLKSF